jgi:hypothetical protein
LSLLYDERDRRLQYLIGRALLMTATEYYTRLEGDARDVAHYMVSILERFFLRPHIQSLFRYHHNRLEDAVDIDYR